MRKAKFYYKNSEAPKPNKPNHIGVNVVMIYQNKLLLEKRKDSNQWGLVGGGLKIDETLEQGIRREIKEETGIDVSKKNIEFYKVYDDPSRIASYPDGNVLRIISFVYKVTINTLLDVKCSEESLELRFFEKDEIMNLDIVESHQEIVSDCISEIME
jgi:ADP-ribose pyrophosphatase YjhB (NUDIX family)